ncbi:helix-turn-helix domain-containing protein [Spirulina subsalsa FACHB-351]|uniref:Helix-turn-helix domain-containing protein n=1 Tax=Spirulina subsalsa FACHB-351 TaxID=234711 RepID=A0ABT3LB13_9CYAN|nr:helix-turn-helix transcriptional regulator [Spirulina subsalsa]MCW6038683.1 helix-turn-helix domain-containing protein [Spirulina subsalsa FACHB-351]
MSLKKLKAELLADPEGKAEYEKIKPRFDVAKAILEMRRTLALTQRELAEKAGIKQSHIARIESGKQSPRLETIAGIAASVGYTVELRLVPMDQASEDNPE